MFRKILSVTVIVCFFLTTLCPYSSAHADTVLGLPQPGTMVNLSPVYQPVLIKGLTVHKDNPFLFDFIVDPGKSKLSQEDLKEESDRMIKYFFAALTIPDKDIWVNLSPYEKDRMIPTSLGVTAMGRDLLAQDYMLKQLTASLIYPQKALGKTFWAKVYAKAKAMYGTTQIPVNTFNKVWIVPQRVGIYEHGQTAFIVDGHLKIMLEQDYLSMTKHNAISNMSSVSETQQSQVNQLGSQIIRQIVLPEIEKEVNDGKNFATLRQIFYAQALAVWFKNNLKQALLNHVYANKGTVKGIDQNNSVTNEAIYKQYLRAYKKGVFNYIKEDIDPITQETTPRKYFSGGYSEAMLASAIQPVELSASATGAQAVEAAHDVDATVVVDSNGADARALTQNVEAEFRVGGIDLRNIKITSGPEVAALLHEFGLSVSRSSDLHVIVIDGQPIDLTQPQTFGQAFDREVQAVGTLDPKDVTPEDSAMLGDLLTPFNVVLGVHFAGIATLSAAIVKSTHEFFKGKNATTMEVKREYYKRFRKDWMHIAGAATIVVTGVILGAMHGINIDKIQIDLLAILTGSKIGGGIFGFEKMADELVAASNATDNVNDPKLKAVETFKGNPGRKFFFNYTDWPVMISLFAIAYTKFPASWNPTILHHVIDFVNKVPHLGWVLPVVPVLMGVGIGATLATQVDKNRPVKDAAMGVKQSPQIINDRMTQYNPSKTDFSKKPVMGYRITSDRFEDIPLAIRQHLGAVDQSKYTPEYLRENIGSVILLQMKDDQPDFFVPPKASLSNYKEIGIDQVNAGNSDLIGHLNQLNVMQISGLVGMATTEVVGMVKMSDIGYNIDDEVVIETPWGDQTKPAGKDAYLRWTDSLKQYTMVNSENGSNPINWIPADAAMGVKLKLSRRNLLRGAGALVGVAALKYIGGEIFLPYQGKAGKMVTLSNNGHFDVTKKTKILIHGANEDNIFTSFSGMAEEATNKDENLVVYAYDQNSSTDSWVTDFIQGVKKLNSLGVDSQNIEYIPYSLGAVIFWDAVLKDQNLFRNVRVTQLVPAIGGAQDAWVFKNITVQEELIKFVYPIEGNDDIRLTRALHPEGEVKKFKDQSIDNLLLDTVGRNNVRTFQPAGVDKVLIPISSPLQGKVREFPGVVHEHIAENPGVIKAIFDRAALANPAMEKWVQGGIDLSEQDSALQVTKDANGGVRVNVDQALIARIEREGMSEVDPVIVNMQPADLQSLFGLQASVR